MTTEDAGARPQTSYALDLADSSYRWYRTAAIRSRRLHRTAEFAAVVLSASVPLAAVLAPQLPQLTALLGSALVVIAGPRAIFHWQENYPRFSQAREAVEEQRRLYHVGADPYGDPTTREMVLVRAVTRVEHEEIGKWAELAERRTDQRPATAQ